MFEIACAFVVWYAVGYGSAMLTALALNGEVEPSDWRWSVLVALLGPIQFCLFLYHTKESE